MKNSYDADIRPIESALPRPWQEERGFDDALYEWMQRAPWLALSALFHALVFLILLAIPWDLLAARDDVAIVTKIDAAPEEPFVEPPEEDPPEVEPDLLPEDPRLQDATEPQVPEAGRR